jgi:hypothetical protein
MSAPPPRRTRRATPGIAQPQGAVLLPKTTRSACSTTSGNDQTAVTAAVAVCAVCAEGGCLLPRAEHAGVVWLADADQPLRHPRLDRVRQLQSANAVQCK